MPVRISYEPAQYFPDLDDLIFPVRVTRCEV